MPPPVKEPALIEAEPDTFRRLRFAMSKKRMALVPHPAGAWIHIDQLYRDQDKIACVMLQLMIHASLGIKPSPQDIGDTLKIAGNLMARRVAGSCEVTGD